MIDGLHFLWDVSDDGKAAFVVAVPHGEEQTARDIVTQIVYACDVANVVVTMNSFRIRFTHEQVAAIWEGTVSRPDIARGVLEAHVRALTL